MDQNANEEVTFSELNWSQDYTCYKCRKMIDYSFKEYYDEKKEKHIVCSDCHQPLPSKLSRKRKRPSNAGESGPQNEEGTFSELNCSPFYTCYKCRKMIDYSFKAYYDEKKVKHIVCYDCYQPLPSKLARKRKRSSNVGEMGPQRPQPLTHILNQQLQEDQENTSQGTSSHIPEQKTPIVEEDEVSLQDASSHNPEQQTPIVEEEEVSLQDASVNITQQGKKCNFCEFVGKMFKRHLKESDNCAQSYFEEFDMGNIEEVMNRINNDQRNKNRTEKRSIEKENRNPRDRSREVEQRRLAREAKNMDIENCYKEMLLSHSNLLKIPCVFCENLFTKGMTQLSEADVELQQMLVNHEERCQQNCYYGKNWICTTCGKIKNANIIDSLGQILDENNYDVQSTVSILKFENEGEFHKVFIPVIRDTLVIEDELEQLNLDETHTTSMILNNYARLLNPGSIEPEAAEVLFNQSDIEPPILLTAGYLDNDIKIQKAETQEKEKQKDVKMGKVKNGILETVDDKDQHSFMKKIRGTGPYQEQKIKNNMAKQKQNGKQNIATNFEIYKQGQIIDPGLATVILRKNDIHVEVILDEREDGSEQIRNLVNCMEDESICDIQNCTNQHKSAVEKVNELYTNGVLPSEVSFLCRYIKEGVDNLVNILIRKHSENYDLHLVFDRNGNVFLRGNIWMEELVTFNRSGQNCRYSPDVQKDYYGMEGTSLNTELEELELVVETDVVSDVTADHIDPNVLDTIREASILETAYVLGRGLQNHWSSQRVETVDLRLQSGRLQCFRKKHINRDVNEEVFRDKDGVEWVKTLTWRRKYELKPDIINHLLIGQMATHFDLFDNRTRNIEVLKNELEANAGIKFGTLQIPLITNTEKYQDELQNVRYLPELILLKNGKILKLKKKPKVILPIGDLDNTGLRILCEPYQSEQQLEDEEDLPAINILTERLKEVFPMYSH